MSTFTFDYQISLSSIVAIFAILFSAVSLFFTIRLNKEISNKNLAINLEKSEIDKEKQIIDWAQRCLIVISNMSHLLKNTDIKSDDFEKEKWKLCSELSAYIDVGRLYFPNYDHEEKMNDSNGVMKAFAFRGIRQPVLDDLVFSYDFFSKTVHGGKSKEFVLDRYKRSFISEVQIRIDPRKKTLKDILNIRAPSGEAIPSIAPTNIPTKK